MCDISAKLIALLDGELPESEASEVRTHLDGCAECRDQVEMYAGVSKAFDAYCDVTMSPAVPGRKRKWKLVLTGAAAAAAAVALFLSLPRAHVQRVQVTTAASPASQQKIVSAAAPAFVKAASVNVKKMHPRHNVAPVQVQPAAWQPAERTVEIAVPADSMYPPGAVPNGVSFLIDVRIAADGSAQQVGMWP